MIMDYLIYINPGIVVSYVSKPKLKLRLVLATGYMPSQQCTCFESLRTFFAQCCVLGLMPQCLQLSTSGSVYVA